MPTVVRQKEITKTRQLEDGSLEEDRTPVFVYVHCFNQACVRYTNLQENLNFEEKVPGIREETSFTYADRGGDMPGIENTHVRFGIQTDSDLGKKYYHKAKDDRGNEFVKGPVCPECDMPLNVSGVPSRKLAQYGVGPGTGLAGAERAAALAAAKTNEANAGRDSQVQVLEKQVEQLTKLVELSLKSKEK